MKKMKFADAKKMTAWAQKNLDNGDRVTIEQAARHAKRNVADMPPANGNYFEVEYEPKAKGKVEIGPVKAKASIGASRIRYIYVFNDKGRKLFAYS